MHNSPPSLQGVFFFTPFRRVHFSPGEGFLASLLTRDVGPKSVLREVGPAVHLEYKVGGEVRSI